MHFVPWQNVADWRCKACGYCCKLYSVVLGFPEWLKITKTGLQGMKPEACKIWPFKVLSEPKYGEPNQAAFDYMGTRLYVYADTMCSGLRYGEPTWEFRYTTIKEFTEIALGIRHVQYKTTRAASMPNQWGRQLFP